MIGFVPGMIVGVSVGEEDGRIELRLNDGVSFRGMTLDTLFLGDHPLEEWREILKPGRMVHIWADQSWQCARLKSPWTGSFSSFGRLRA